MTAAPGPLFLARAEVDRLMGALQVGGRSVIGPRVADGAIGLAEIASAADLPAGVGVDDQPGRAVLKQRADRRLFDYPVGMMSWKRWTFPPSEMQAAWVTGGDGVIRYEAAGAPEPGPLAFVGVRACEIAALRIHDRALQRSNAADPEQSARGDDTLIVAVECAVAGTSCFCSSMGSGPELNGGYDIALSELDEGFVVTVGTAAGAAVVDGLELAPATPAQRAEAEANVERTRRSMGPTLPLLDAARPLMDNPRSPRWAQVAERCLACANCTLVCPTCFCTSASQRSDLDGTDAITERRWDSCFTLDFARVAGGNFRSRPQDRYRQWLTHKFGTWWEQFGSSGCVGCGRCITWCPVGIDVREEVLAITAAALPTIEPETSHVRPAIVGGDAPSAIDTEWTSAIVVSTTRETADVVTLRLATSDPGLLAGRPGQFVMAALPALSSPPISISRFHDDGIELTIRAAGSATAAMARLDRGARLSLRGPLGRGWPVEMADGRDVQIVTGGIGIAPLRPLLDALIARRERIGAIHLAYGARTPADRVFRQELDALGLDRTIVVAQTVDRAGPEWLGRVGVVTQVIDRVMCECDRTVAFVCGPERMMSATADVLRQRAVPDERIFVTLERHMECGLGLCGHCQLGRFMVCRDGPVFSLAELGGALGEEGL